MKIEVEINFEDGAFVPEIYYFQSPINSNISASLYRDTLQEAIADVRITLSNCDFTIDNVIVSTTENSTKRREWDTGTGVLSHYVNKYQLIVYLP